MQMVETTLTYGRLGLPERRPPLEEEQLHLLLPGLKNVR